MEWGRGANALEFKLTLLAKFKELWKSYGALLAIAVCALLFHWLSGESFLTARNLSNLSRQICINLTLAVGMTLVILTSGIDLSVGSVLALGGMLAAISQVHGGFSEMGAFGAVMSFFVALLTGGICGALTGVMVSRLNITPFIVTLGMMVICRGLTLIVSGAQAVAPVSSAFGSLSSDYLPPQASVWLLAGLALFTTLRNGLRVYRKRLALGAFVQSTVNVGSLCFLGILVFGSYRGIPFMVFGVTLLTILGMFALRFSRYGRFLFAIGGNREASELSGVPVTRSLWVTYFIMGCLAGLAGAMDVARVNGAVPSAGDMAELDAIAAVVIGGTSLMGGVGTLSGTLFGALMMGVLNNGMSLIGMSEHYQKVFKGIVIILAVCLDRRSKRRD